MCSTTSMHGGPPSSSLWFNHEQAMGQGGKCRPGHKAQILLELEGTHPGHAWSVASNSRSRARRSLFRKRKGIHSPHFNHSLSIPTTQTNLSDTVTVCLYDPHHVATKKKGLCGKLTTKCWLHGGWKSNQLNQCPQPNVEWGPNLEQAQIFLGRVLANKSATHQWT